MINETEARSKMTEIAHRMYKKGLVAGTDGNLCCRLDEKRYLMTPSGVSKGNLTDEDFIIVDPAGKLIDGTRNPSSERRIHLEALNTRHDCVASIHSHAPSAVALSMLPQITDINFIIPESVLYLGRIILCDYATPTTPQGPEVVRDHLADNEAFILPRHGTLTIGRTLHEAFEKLEALEHCCAILVKAIAMNQGKMPQRLSETEGQTLWDIHCRAIGREKAFPKM